MPQEPEVGGGALRVADCATLDVSYWDFSSVTASVHRSGGRTSSRRPSLGLFVPDLVDGVGYAPAEATQ